MIYLCPKEGVSFDELSQDVKKKVHDDLSINIVTEKKELNALLDQLGMETELKEKRIVDNRPKD